MLDFTLSTRAGQLEVDSFSKFRSFEKCTNSTLNMQTRLVSRDSGLSSDLSVEIGLVNEIAVCD